MINIVSGLQKVASLTNQPGVPNLLQKVPEEQAFPPGMYFIVKLKHLMFHISMI